MSKDTVAWVSIVMVIVAVTLAVLRHNYVAWGVMAVDVALLAYAIRKK